MGEVRWAGEQAEHPGCIPLGMGGSEILSGAAQGRSHLGRDGRGAGRGWACRLEIGVGGGPASCKVAKLV